MPLAGVAPSARFALHLVIHPSDASAACALASASVDASLQNTGWWNPLLELLYRRNAEIASCLVQDGLSLPVGDRHALPLARLLRGDLISFRELHHLIRREDRPPLARNRFWKRSGNLHANTSLVSFDGLKFQRTHQSFLFLEEGDKSHGIPKGSFLILNHDDQKIFNTFENAGARPCQILRAWSSLAHVMADLGVAGCP
ncbi:uncharacterized protein J3R85_020711 [Psidium guajava]|nr:uncharacterized protein J3R85_020711 [Psidium guajava]